MMGVNFKSAIPTVSIVVIGRNEGERLVRCFESIARMRRPEGIVEVIYVDSGSTDQSVRNAEQYSAKVIRLETAHPSAAAARNAGWRATNAPIVLFLDGDTVLDPEFVTNSVSLLDDPDVAIVFGHCREIDPDASIYNRILDLDWMVRGGPVEFCGGNALVRREAIDKVGGYNECLMAAEDTELCSRIRAEGYKIVHVDRPMVGHDLAMTRLSQYWRRATRTGYAYAQVSEHIRRQESPIWYRQARRNRLQAAVIILSLVGVLSFAIAFRSIAVFVCATAIAALIVVRTAWRSRWNGASLTTRLLHAVHSHLVQLPLAIGQIKYGVDKWTRRTAMLIEYKDKPADGVNVAKSLK